MMLYSRGGSGRPKDYQRRVAEFKPGPHLVVVVVVIVFGAVKESPDVLVLGTADEYVKIMV
jgi:hypothetical protein